MIARIVSTALKRSLAPFVFRTATGRECASASGELGLYVHIPFCRSICSFCPYYKVRYDPDAAARFADALVEEIRREGERESRDGRRRAVTSVYFGGGTPALMLDELPRIQRALRQSFVVEGPSAIELHPADVSEETLAALRGAGFGMVSLGMQSFDRRSLVALGRRGGELDAHVPAGVARARAAGFGVVDVDVIFGIPGQRADDVRRDIRLAAGAGATQVSTYPLISFSYTSTRAREPARRRRRELLDAVLSAAAEAGLERTSVWTFGRSDRPRYSSVTRDSYLGFGPSAASLLPGSFAVNHFSVDAYVRSLADGRLPVALVARLSPRERALFWLFWQTYNLWIDRDAFGRMFGVGIDAMFGAELAAATRLGLLSRGRGGYAVTARGARLYHQVEQLYTHRYIDRVWRVSRGGHGAGRLAIR